VKSRQSLLGWAVITAGFVIIGVTWGQVQGTHVVAVQLSYMTSGGLVGLALVFLGTSLLRAEDLRAIRGGVEELRDRIDDLEHDLADTKDWLQTLEVKRIQSLAAADGTGAVVHS
jgi:hypothetical protein